MAPILREDIMTTPKVTLNDRYDIEKEQILLNGTQALVRLMLMQKARDTAAGFNTAGYVSGYRGSPLGAVDLQMSRAEKVLQAADVKFHPGLNEDLAATAIWGTQQAELRGEGKFEGVFNLWYGKGPGVDRTGDVMRHANMAGTSEKGGVLMALGDDHTGESSTTLHQSEWALVDAYMPILSPAGVQEILDYGLYGIAMSRFAGVWVGLKCMKDTIEATAVIDGSLDRIDVKYPDLTLPNDGLNIRLGDTPVAQEERMIQYKRFAAEAFGRANKLDKPMMGDKSAKVGFVAAGKNWLDLEHAFSLLGIDETEARRLGIATYKVGMTWPLDMESFKEWSEDLDLIVVVEEKRKLIEVQAKEAIFNDRRARRVFGWKDDQGNDLFQTRYALDPNMIAEKVGKVLIDEGCSSSKIEAGLAHLSDVKRAENAEEITSRIPYFCSGCPHNSSTKLPEGARAYAGIGCHYMVQWMDRDTVGFTQMGGEGANWIGEAPFSTRDHVFQNLGDGTYNHSGVLAIRAALAANTNITYKILFNDAVAMTGGQENEGDLTADRITREIQAMGVKEIAIVYDEKEDIDFARFPSGIKTYPRSELMNVQEKMATIKGVSAIVYIQTCAAEKRRRRKRGLFPDPDARIFINTDICEGCGDCGVQSNCVSIAPVETEFGRKRKIDQSSCNKDFSCVDGFCPSFVTVTGAQIKKTATKSLDLPDLPDPALPKIDGTFNVVITGVGGTGVVTIGAILAQAAHLDGKGAGMMEMAGLAQKGGAVHIHCRLAEKPSDISAIRVAPGEAHALIGGDLVTSAGAKTIGLLHGDRTGAVVNGHDIVTGEFTQNRDFKIPHDRLTLQLEARLQGRVAFYDATELAKALLGDSIFSNMMILGSAFQQGLVPVSKDAIKQAIALNGAAVERNLRAFDLGRWAMLHPGEARKLLRRPAVEEETLDGKVAARAAHLAAYQSDNLRRKYLTVLDGISDVDLKDAVAHNYHKLLAYKDEYEVARLHLLTAEKAKAEFDGDFKLQYHLAPPFLGGSTHNGRPKKRIFGGWMRHGFKILAWMKGVRGTGLDPFGRTEERRAERALIAQYEADLTAVLPLLTAKNHGDVLALLQLPDDIRGFGPVKKAAMAEAARKRDVLWAAIRGEPAKKAA
ncbi:MAG: indolepyruvate ferredoxin oxidoreductase family protein [Halocynthiibacter sp.]